MLVSSVGYFSADTQTAADRAENNRVAVRHVVTKGLTPSNHENKSELNLLQSLKNVVREISGNFSSSSKDMKNPLDMIA